MSAGIDDDRQLVVLLVDDCVAVRDLYELALRDDAHVVTASRGEEALALARTVQFDAVILDVNMPGLDGWEVCRSLKAHGDTSSIPIIMLTDDDRENVPTRALAVGASAVLRKPCSAEKLLSTIGAARLKALGTGLGIERRNP